MFLLKCFCNSQPSSAHSSLLKGYNVTHILAMARKIAVIKNVILKHSTFDIMFAGAHLPWMEITAVITFSMALSIMFIN